MARTYLIECSEAFLAQHPVGYRSGQQLEVPGGRASMELREPTAAAVATRLGSGKLAEDESEGSSPSGEAAGCWILVIRFQAADCSTLQH